MSSICSTGEEKSVYVGRWFGQLSHVYLGSIFAAFVAKFMSIYKGFLIATFGWKRSIDDLKHAVVENLCVRGGE